MGDRMVSEAEQYRAEDEANKGKAEAKNGLENYCFTMRNTLQEEKLKEKFEGGDKEAIEKAVQDTLDWLDKNQRQKKTNLRQSWRRWWHAGWWHARLRWRCSSRCRWRRWPNRGGG